MGKSMPDLHSHCYGLYNFINVGRGGQLRLTYRFPCVLICDEFSNIDGYGSDKYSIESLLADNDSKFKPLDMRQGTNVANPLRAHRRILFTYYTFVQNVQPIGSAFILYR